MGGDYDFFEAVTKDKGVKLVLLPRDEARP